MINKKLVLPRVYPYIDKNGNQKSVTFNYSIYFKDGKLDDIRNEYGFSVETTSDTWEHFNNILCKESELID